MLISVKVRPVARKERFVETKARCFEADVKEPAENNAANIRVRTLLARHFSVSPKAVRFVSGIRSPNKKFDVIQ